MKRNLSCLLPRMALLVTCVVLCLTSTPAVGQLMWSGTVNGDWDLTTLNWNSGTASYQESGGVGDAVAFYDDASTYNVNITTTVTPAAITVQNDTTDYVLTGVGKISGAGDLSKWGSGALTIETANDHSGGTTLYAGTLNLNHPSALGTGTFAIAGGTNDNTSANSISNVNNNAIICSADIWFTGTKNLDLGTGALDIGESSQRLICTLGGELTVGGVISGPANWNKAYFGTLRLNGLNTFTGQLRINGGTLVANTIADANSPCSLGQSANVIRFGNNANPGILTYVGTGGSSDRQIQVGHQANNVNRTGGATINNEGSGPLTFTAATFNSAHTTATAARTITLGGANTGDNEIQGAIVDNAESAPISVTKTGAGKWILSGANTFSGNIQVNEGELVLGSAHAGSGGVTCADGTTLGLNSTGSDLVVRLSSLTLGSTSGGALRPRFDGQSGYPTEPAAYVTNLTLNGTITANVEFSASDVPADHVVPLIGYETLSGSPTLVRGTISGSQAAGWAVVNDTSAKQIQLVPVPVLTWDFSTGSPLSLSWTFLGAIVESNSVNVANPGLWYPIQGSESVTSLSITPDPAQTNVFYRLLLP